MNSLGWRSFYDWFMFSSTMKTIISTFILLFALIFFKIATSNFKPTDAVPEFKIIDAAKQKEFGQLTAKVKAGLFVKNFSEFDVKNNKFVADCVVWFEFNSDEVMLGTIGMFSFDNGDIIMKSEPDVKIQERKTIAKYDVKVVFKSSLNYHHFPLDGHRISLILTNNFVTPREMFFTVENGAFRLAEGIFIADWLLKDTVTDAGYTESSLDRDDQSKISSRPQVSFTISVDVKGVRKLLIIFLPILIAIFLSMFSYVASYKNPTQRQILSTASISAITGYRFVIENLLPPVGYFTTTDYFFIFMLLVAFFNFVFQTIFVWHQNQASQLSPEAQESAMHFLRIVNTVTFLIVSCIIVVGMGYIIVAM